MLTQIEIDGFKTFKDFKVELAPFQVIVGPNGSGKSNLFDALQLLSRLAEVDDLALAFQAPDNDPGKVRGDAYELFTVFPGGQRTNRIRMAVEMLVDRRIRDGFGKEAELAYTRLRYEIVITLQESNDKFRSERLKVTHEALTYLSPEQDSWSRKYGLSSQNGWLPNFAGSRSSFISTLDSPSPSETSEAQREPLTIYLYADGAGEEREFPADIGQRTILSAVSYTNYPHAFAARKEMVSWNFLHLSHAALHKRSSVNAQPYMSVDGSNLPTMLARMKDEDEFALNDVSRDLANLVSDVTGVELMKDDILNRYTVWVKYVDGRSFPSSVLSDGTLRLLALATIRNDSQFQGLLCIEELENGVSPSYLKDVAHLLRGLATDFTDSERIDEPLRQVLATTHSPAFISQPDTRDSLLFAFMVTRVEPRKHAFQITEMVPVITTNTQHLFSTDEDKGREAYTIHRVKSYLDTESFDETRTNLGRR